MSVVCSELCLGQSIQEWTKYFLWKTAFKRFDGIWSTVSFVSQAEMKKGGCMTGLSTFCGRQPLKDLMEYGLLSHLSVKLK